MAPFKGDLVESLMRYEDGDMGETEELALFAELIRSGLAWQLQGFYGRRATALIEGGIISADGRVIQ